MGGDEEGGGGGGERQEREGTQQDEADDGLAVIQRYEFSELMREVDRETAGLCCSKGLWLHRRRRGKPLRRNSWRWGSFPAPDTLTIASPHPPPLFN